MTFKPFKHKEIVDALSGLHDTYIVVPADKTSNYIVLVCKKTLFAWI